MKKSIKPWQGWLCLAAFAMVAFAIWYTVKSAPPNDFFKNTTPNDITGISFLLENGDYGERTTVQSATDDKSTIQSLLKRMSQERFYYHNAGGEMTGLGENLLINIDTANQSSVMLQMKKIKRGDNLVIIIIYEGKQYFLERFSEEKELALYDDLYRFASKAKAI